MKSNASGISFRNPRLAAVGGGAAACAALEMRGIACYSCTKVLYR